MAFDNFYKRCKYFDIPIHLLKDSRFTLLNNEFLIDGKIYNLTTNETYEMPDESNETIDKLLCDIFTPIYRKKFIKDILAKIPDITLTKDDDKILIFGRRNILEINFIANKCKICQCFHLFGIYIYEGDIEKITKNILNEMLDNIDF